MSVVAAPTASRLLAATAAFAPNDGETMKLALSGWLVALRWSAARLGRDKRGNAAIELR